MLKKFFLTSASLFFGATVLFTSVFRASAQTIIPDQDEAVIEFNITEATPEPVREETVDYILPWPGILPDHLLYPIKALRDRVWLLLTVDPWKKTELLIKLADKRIYAASLLVDKENYEASAATALKAEQYLWQAVEEEKVAREKDNEKTLFLLEALQQSVLKHEEMLALLEDRLPEVYQGVVSEAKKTNVMVHQAVGTQLTPPTETLPVIEELEEAAEAAQESTTN